MRPGASGSPPPFFLSPLPFLNLNADLTSSEAASGFDATRVFFFASLLFSGTGGGLALGGGGMDLSKVGEKFLSSVRTARSLGLLPPVSDRPEREPERSFTNAAVNAHTSISIATSAVSVEDGITEMVPARAVAAAAVARALAGIPPHQRQSLASSSEELSSIYGSKPAGQVVDDLEEDFYEEKFDPVRHILRHLPDEEIDGSYFEEKATLRLAQLDRVSERLAHHVMEYHEDMVKGMHLVRELEKDLKVANVICKNGRRHLTSSMNEVSRDLVVTTCSRKKQVLLDMLPILTELRNAVVMQVSLENHVDQGNFSKAFQVLSEYLQLLDSLSELSVTQEMSRGVEVWLGKTLQKLDSLLLGVCQDFKENGYTTVVDAYALIGDVTGLAEKMQSFFMQEVLSETHGVLKKILLEDQEASNGPSSRLTYSDLCRLVPESKFRQCLLATLAVLFKLMSSYYEIMSFQPEDKVSVAQAPHEKQNSADASGVSLEVPHNGPETGKSLTADNFPLSESADRGSVKAGVSQANSPASNGTLSAEDSYPIDQSRNAGSEASSSGSPWFQLRKDATIVVSQTLLRGRKNLWQLTTSRASVLLSSASVCSTSIHQFLRNYEDLNVFILAGEAFCGAEAVEFRLKLKNVCENYFASFHRQNIHALKMVLERETWLKLPPETLQVVSFAGLLGDGAALIVSSSRNSLNKGAMHSDRLANATVETGSKKSGFSYWLNSGNPFLAKLNFKENHDSFSPTGSDSGDSGGKRRDDRATLQFSGENTRNGRNSHSEDENEDLHADFIDEDSQLPSRISKPSHSRSSSFQWNDEELTAQTGSSLCLLKCLDKYARLMQKLEIVNVEFFKGICQLFGIFFHFVYETFVHQNTNSSGKGSTDLLSYRLKTSLSRITQDCDQWIRPQSQSISSSSPASLNSSLTHMDVMPTSPLSNNSANAFGASLGLKERCAAAETISLVARLLHRSRPHLQTMLLQNNAAVVEDFYVNLVDSVPELTQHIHKTTARLLLHINGYADRIASAKWEVKELGLEHNGYVDLLLGELRHYKTRLAHGGIQKEVQDLLLEYGFEIVAETLVEGLSRVKRCSDEGRALMSLDLQVLINGLRHFVPIDVKPKFQIVEAFIKAYYLPETEYVHWARAHPEYSKSQIVGLVNLVAAMKGWKRKTRLEVIEKIEGTGS